MLPPRVGDAEGLESDRGMRGWRHRAPAGQRSLEQLEHLFRCAETFGGCVEVLPHQSDRQVGLGGEDEHEKRDREGDLAFGKAYPDSDGDERHRQAREELQRKGRQKGDPQYPHGGAAVTLAHRTDCLGLALRPTEDLERGQT
jgi:hypothetical protein